MSTHPNVILMAVLTPDGLSRKTMRDILVDNNLEKDSDFHVKIGGESYAHMIMESKYDNDLQISAAVGDLVFHDFVTYGYGECIEWSSLEERKIRLKRWAMETSEKHHCSYKIVVTANYW